MRLLLDTQLLIWVAVDSPRLSATARALIMEPQTEVVFSALSIWEVAIKHSLRRADVPVAPDILHRALLQAGWEELPILSQHSYGVVDLAPIHGDPFDRLLVAQAKAEGMALLTSDRVLGGYGAFVLTV